MVQANTFILLVACPHSQGSVIKKYRTNNITERKERKQNKRIYSNLHTFAIWASLGVIRAGRNKVT